MKRVAETSACAPRRRRRSDREVGGSDGRNGGMVRRFTRDLSGCHWAPAVRALTRGAQALSHRSGVFVDPTSDRSRSIVCSVSNFCARVGVDIPSRPVGPRSTCRMCARARLAGKSPPSGRAGEVCKPLVHGARTRQPQARTVQRSAPVKGRDYGVRPVATPSMDIKNSFLTVMEAHEGGICAGDRGRRL